LAGNTLNGTLPTQIVELTALTLLYIFLAIVVRFLCDSSLQSASSEQFVWNRPRSCACTKYVCAGIAHESIRWLIPVGVRREQFGGASFDNQLLYGNIAFFDWPMVTIGTHVRKYPVQ
jgi:hypothetical protein